MTSRIPSSVRDEPRTTAGAGIHNYFQGMNQAAEHEQAKTREQFAPKSKPWNYGVSNVSLAWHNLTTGLNEAAAKERCQTQQRWCGTVDRMGTNQLHHQ